MRTISAAILLLGLPGAALAQASPQLRASVDDEQRALVLDMGPVSLPAMAGHNEAAHSDPLRAVLPASGWVHGYEVELVDGRGRALPHSLLHHMNVILPERRELFSPIMQRVAAAGSETAPVSFPRLVGFPIERGDSILLLAMLHNPTMTNYDSVYLRVRMPFTRRSKAILPRLSVQPFYVDVMPPAGGHAYDLPPGKSSRSWEGSPARSGRVLAIGGHLHTYGTRLRFEDVTAGKVVWEARPQLDSAGVVVGMPSKMFLWRARVPLHADHVYRLTAFYDNPTGRTIPLGAMGALGGIVVPTGDDPWPRVQRQDPQYREDVHTVFVGAYGDRPAAPPMHHH